MMAAMYGTDGKRCKDVKRFIQREVGEMLVYVVE
jgi:hypothetical protein